MSSKGYATPLRLEIGANTLLQFLTLGMTACVVIVLLLLPLPFVANLLAAFITLFLLRHIWYRRAELGGPSVKLVWDGEDQWWWTSDGNETAVVLQNDTYIMPHLVVLNFRVVGERRRCSAVLTPAATGAETFRRMLVRFQITPQDSSPA
jgi:hypothetical protein